MNLIILLILCNLVALVTSRASWNLSQVNLPQDVFISKIAVWRNRAFLAIPRQSWDDRKPTFLEAPFPESGSTIVIFPNLKGQSYDVACRSLKSVTGVDVDIRGRLFVLDVPHDHCEPKIIVYDLRRNNQEITMFELRGVPKKNLKTIVIDPIQGLWGSLAYVGEAEEETLIVYSLGQNRLWKLHLDHGPDVPRVYCTDMAFSRKNSMLYMTGFKTLDLFSINLDDVRDRLSFLHLESRQNTSVNWLGKKLGYSSGLLCDQKCGLHYFLVSDRASLRWDTKSNLNAEYHSVLLQREDVPYITDYVSDSQKHIWGLVNAHYPLLENKHTIETKRYKIPRIKIRTVRIDKQSLYTEDSKRSIV